MANLLWEQILCPDSPLQPGHPASLWECSVANWAAPCFLSSGLFCSSGQPFGTCSWTHCAGALSLSLSVSRRWSTVSLYPRIISALSLPINSLPEAPGVTSPWSLPSAASERHEPLVASSKACVLNIYVVLSRYQLESGRLVKTNGLIPYKAFSISIINFLLRLSQVSWFLILTSSYDFLIHSLTVLNDNFCFFFWLMK